MFEITVFIKQKVKSILMIYYHWQNSDVPI